VAGAGVTDGGSQPARGMGRLLEVLPGFSAELVEALLGQGDPDLAAQVPGLRVVALCGCGDHVCGSFYVVPPPDGPWGPGHRDVVVVGIAKGMVVLDVVGEMITFVEVLDRPDVAGQLRARKE
jgi:hypothetical protein